MVAWLRSSAKVPPTIAIAGVVKPLLGPARSYPPPGPVAVQTAPVEVENVWFPVPPLMSSEMMSVLAAVVFESTPENVGLALSLPIVKATFQCRRVGVIGYAASPG